jgi:hypothetical protein
MHPASAPVAAAHCSRWSVCEGGETAVVQPQRRPPRANAAVPLRRASAAVTTSGKPTQTKTHCSGHGGAGTLDGSYVTIRPGSEGNTTPPLFDAAATTLALHSWWQQGR